MARSFAGGSTNPPYLKSASAGIGLTNGCSISCWFLSDQASGGPRYLAGWGNGSRVLALVQSGNRLGIGDKGAGSPISSLATTANSFAAGTWNHAVGIVAADSDRRAILNGDVASKATVNPSAAFIASTDVWVGANIYELAGFGSGFDGQVAQLAIYAEILPDDAIVALASGLHPLSVRPDSLRFLSEISGRASPEAELIGGKGLALHNGPGVAADPRLIRRGRRRAVVPGAAASGSGTVAVTGAALWGTVGQVATAWDALVGAPGLAAAGEPGAATTSFGAVIVPAGSAAAVAVGVAATASDGNIAVAATGTAAAASIGSARGTDLVLLTPGGCSGAGLAGIVVPRWDGHATPLSALAMMKGGDPRVHRDGWGAVPRPIPAWAETSRSSAIWTTRPATTAGWLKS